MPQDTQPQKRGLLASTSVEGQPVKAVYFFPGNTRDAGVYAANPLDSRDTQWNVNPVNQQWVLDRMLKAHVNVITMSYWRELSRWSPMAVIEPSLIELLSAIKGRPLVVMPAIESGFDEKHPEMTHWEFNKDFPTADPAGRDPSLGMMSRIGSLINLFNDKMQLWSKIYDRTGQGRYAINIIHACSNLIDPTDQNADEAFAEGFERLAAAVLLKYHIPVGFTLDTIANKGGYSAVPNKSGAVLEHTGSVLAIHGFASEIFGDVIINGTGCDEHDPTSCIPHDNNIDNIDRIIDWKKGALNAWLQTGVPIYFDVSGGYDARRIFPQRAKFYGDNMGYTDDRWRNALSQMKGRASKESHLIPGTVILKAW